MAKSRKTLQLQVRVTEREKAQIRQMAKESGQEMSVWILSKLLVSVKNKFQELAYRLVQKPGDANIFAALNDLISGLSAPEFLDCAAKAPHARLSSEDLNYLTAMVEYAAAQKNVPAPAWTTTIAPLGKPLFGSELQNLRLHLLLASPVPFRRRNIFIDSTIGHRV